MAEVTIRMRPNGPMVVEGPVTILDSQGNRFPISSDKPGIALCRCGQSKRKPFCDGSHKACAFVSDEMAPPPDAPRA
jgi:CDGSH-type Zn-finger protein